MTSFDQVNEPPWPVVSVVIPDSKLTYEVTEFVRTVHSLLQFHHSSLVCYWSALLGKHRGLRFDDELLYVSAIFRVFVHDTVSQGRIDVIVHNGAEVRRVPGTYDDTMREAARQAEALRRSTANMRAPFIPRLDDCLQPDCAIVPSSATGPSIATASVDRPLTIRSSIAVLGIVYGDLGMRSLYTYQTIVGSVGGHPSVADALGLLSLVVWTLRQWSSCLHSLPLSRKARPASAECLNP